MEISVQSGLPADYKKSQLGLLQDYSSQVFLLLPTADDALPVLIFSATTNDFLSPYFPVNFLAHTLKCTSSIE